MTNNGGDDVNHNGSDGNVIVIHVVSGVVATKDTK